MLKWLAEKKSGSKILLEKWIFDKSKQLKKNEELGIKSSGRLNLLKKISFEDMHAGMSCENRPCFKGK